MQVSTDDLRQITLRLLGHLDATGRTTLTIENDYHWCMSSAERHDPCKEPTEFTLGQLSDEWEDLQKIRQGESEPIGYALGWLAGILQTIGETNVH